MSPHPEDDPTNDFHYVEGCHGTLAEQNDEAYYDDRSDADDDLEKGKIKFPKNKFYGREKELEKLLKLYEACEEEGKTCSNLKDEGVNDAASASAGSRVLFLSGHCGVGKSTLVHEFLKRVQDKSPGGFLSATGKCNKNHESEVDDFDLFGRVFESIVQKLLPELEEEATDGFDQKNTLTNHMGSKILEQIEGSEIIGFGTEGNKLLQTVFPMLRPFLLYRSSDESYSNVEEPLAATITPATLQISDNLKQCTCEFLSILCQSTNGQPVILFLDDLQHANGPTLEMLSSLLLDKNSRSTRNIFIIGAYRSNEVSSDHPLSTYIAEVEHAREEESYSPLFPPVEKMDLFFLLPDDIAEFIADCLNKEQASEVADLVEVVYQHSMGDITYVKRTLEDMVSKNSLYYDIISFDWTWTDVTKMALVDEMRHSGNIHVTVRKRVEELPVEMQRMLIIRAYFTKASNPAIMTELLNSEGFEVDESETFALMKQACTMGILIYSILSDTHNFTHEHVREACKSLISEEERDDLLVRVMSSRFHPWEGRLDRMEVFDRDYIPLDWEAKEMTALIDFLGVSDPYKAGDSEDAPSPKAPNTRSPLRRHSAVIRDTSQSKESCDGDIDAQHKVSKRRSFLHTRGAGDLIGLRRRTTDEISRRHSDHHQTRLNHLPKKSRASSISAGVAKFLTDSSMDRSHHKEHHYDPIKATEEALESLFFPSDSDPESVVLKHGLVNFQSPFHMSESISSQCILLLFSRGFVVATFNVTGIIPLFLSLNGRDLFSAKSVLEYLEAKLNRRETNHELDDKEMLKECFKEIGMPECNQLLPTNRKKLRNQLQRLDPSSLLSSFTRDVAQRRLSNESHHKTENTKIEKAALLTSVVCIDRLGVCNRGKVDNEHSVKAETSFAVTLSDQADTQLIFECSTQEDRDEWIYSLQKCVIRAYETSSNIRILNAKTKLGWQHLITRSEYSSHVIKDDVKALRRVLEQDFFEYATGTTYQKANLDLLDEYNGYGAIHYAVILGHTKCLKALLKAGADAGLKDKEGHTPMHHAKLRTKGKCAELLEKYGRKNDFGEQFSLKGFDSSERSCDDDVSISKALSMIAMGGKDDDASQHSSRMGHDEIEYDESRKPREKKRSLIEILRLNKIDSARSLHNEFAEVGI